uniref:AB hydrolase-1 domain-containing protein n=1 Tax=Timspurckia oligopyrenoides TaxID=708627 RepID=A0A7S0ZLL7_9RHOD|mmetsp:Transcript_9328/g.16804  ORF Transcript_9328/g.16804 Transcript_9328/m.16804 type:complete len:350 (+) Transcript_9328:98-1147(+)
MTMQSLRRILHSSSASIRLLSNTHPCPPIQSSHYSACSGTSCSRLFSTQSPSEQSLINEDKGKCIVPLNYVKISAKKDLSEDSLSSTTPAVKLPPVIMLHGVLASSGTYRSVLKRADFAPMRDIYALDLRNHGNSPHVSEMSYDGLIRDVRNFMSDEGIGNACVIGHSMGGKVGMMLALEDPEKVSELIVLDIAPKIYEGINPAQTACHAMYAVDLETCESRSDVENALEANGITDGKVRSFLMTNLVSDEGRPGRYTWRLNIQSILDAFPSLFSFPTDLEHTKASYSGRTLFLHGDQSSFINEESDTKRILELFPNAKLQLIQDCGHWIVSQQPDAFVKAVNDFLGDE